MTREKNRHDRMNAKRLAIALSSTGTVSVALTLVAPAAATRAELGGALNLDFNAGADTLAVLEFTGGDTQEIKPGNGIMLSVGGGLIFFGPSQHRLELVLDVGVKYSTMRPAENADLSFVRVPIELLAFYRNEQAYFRVGGGTALYASNSISGSGAASGIDTSFDPAFAGIVQADFISGGFFGGLRYTILSLRPDGGSRSFAANSIGVGVGYYFQFPGE